jgi:extradiol dioxygenase family protein
MRRTNGIGSSTKITSVSIAQGSSNVDIGSRTLVGAAYAPLVAAPPILHLSLAVRDLEASRAFYAGVLGCEIGRVRGDWIDVWFHGLQLTLHEDPDQVVAPGDRAVRHFGVTLSGDELAALLARVEDHDVDWVRPLQTDGAGTPREQTKAMIADPSGNAIELKSYADPEAAFAD